MSRYDTGAKVGPTLPFTTIIGETAKQAIAALETKPADNKYSISVHNAEAFAVTVNLYNDDVISSGAHTNFILISYTVSASSDMSFEVVNFMPSGAGAISVSAATAGTAGNVQVIVRRGSDE